MAPATPNFGTLEDALNRVPYALTLSDLSAQDQPLIFMNDAFRKMTGCDDSHLGQNCRFLQADLENDAARAEVRAALTEARRTQVVLKNRRMSGEMFHNLLLLEPIGPAAGGRVLALGAQFELTAEELADVGTDTAIKLPAVLEAAVQASLTLKLRRRRIAADSAVQLLKSWMILNELSGAT
ncbi:PAS domain-containing protein [Mesobacterium pallidum]|uniref:PAS domain-containing protein n=1 Tax=Mesobacterium pallidum TaxID=2872037 RepID=UPI001EE2BB5E|nr:PAS domain-containing protein [Mesobacterium pallidum]